jgi:hypothetical protein
VERSFPPVGFIGMPRRSQARPPAGRTLSRHLVATTDAGAIWREINSR